jgi:hypothetical protein
MLVRQHMERTGTAVAQKIQASLVDDLDGSDAEETVLFALDGSEYEIDLNARHARALRDALGRYVRGPAGRKRRPAASPRWAQSTGSRAGHRRGPPVGQGAGH